MTKPSAMYITLFILKRQRPLQCTSLYSFSNYKALCNVLKCDSSQMKELLRCFKMRNTTVLFSNDKVRKRAKIRNQYNQAPHLTQDTNGKVTTSQLDIKNESQQVSPFPAGDHKASINRCARKHNKRQAEIT